MKTLIKILVMLFGIALLAGVMAWMAGMFSSTQEPGRVAPPVTTATGPSKTIETEEVPIIEQVPGTLRARNETTISSRITARVETVHVRASDSVEPGDVIITLDDRDLQARVGQASKQVESATASLEEARAEYERSATLFEEGAVSRAKLDSAEASFESAEAELARAEQSVDEAEAALSYAVITAPLAGRVVDRYVEPGDLAVPGKTLVRLYDPNSLRLEADVRESLAMTLKRGEELQVVIDSVNESIPAKIEEIVPHSDPASRSFLVKATLSAGEQLYPGMFGRLMIPAGSEERIYLPSDAIYRVGQLEYVLVDNNGAPTRRYVRTGSSSSRGTEVLSGLAAGEKVLLKRS